VAAWRERAINEGNGDRSYLLNAWYAAAWAPEGGRKLPSRKICGKQVVLYRDLEGQPVALQDACWRRLLPLSKGITPIIGIAIALRKRNARVRLIYAAQTPAELAFSAELDEHLGCHWQRAVSSAGTRLDLRRELSSLSSDGEAYICGPARPLRAARAVWRDLDRPPENLRFETFATSGNREPQPFTVNLPHLGVEIRVLENESIGDASRRSNVGVLFDCLRGECGLCALPVLALKGEIDHRDVFLSEAERKDGSSAPAYRGFLGRRSVSIAAIGQSMSWSEASRRRRCAITRSFSCKCFMIDAYISRRKSHTTSPAPSFSLTDQILPPGFRRGVLAVSHKAANLPRVPQLGVSLGALVLLTCAAMTPGRASEPHDRYGRCRQ
jgi:ferredoxin